MISGLEAIAKTFLAENNSVNNLVLFSVFGIKTHSQGGFH